MVRRKLPADCSEMVPAPYTCLSIRMPAPLSWATKVSAPAMFNAPGFKVPLVCVMLSPASVSPNVPPVRRNAFVTVRLPVPPSVPLLWVKLVVAALPLMPWYPLTS